VLRNNWPVLLRQMGLYLAAALAVLAAALYALLRWRRAAARR
jgi:hypothetical protein